MPGRSVEIRRVDHWFQPAGASTGHAICALDGIDITVRAGEFVAIVGPSGCGKTTILNMLAGLLEPSAGELLLDGRRPRIGDPEIGYLLSRDALLPWRTARENVALPLEIRGTPTDESRRRVNHALEAVGLIDFADAFPAQLSHGMRQRVAVARTMAPAPTTLLMDEPFSALDAQTRMTLQEQFLHAWEQQKSTVLFVTHDLAEAILLADRVIVFSARPGRIKCEFHIELPRPRSVLELQSRSEYHELFQRVWLALRDEMVTA